MPEINKTDTETKNLLAQAGLNAVDWRPLRELLLSKFPIERETREFLADLLDPAARTKTRLTLRRRGAGRPPQRLLLTVGYRVAEKIRLKTGYYAAIDEVAEEGLELGEKTVKLGEKTVKKSYGLFNSVLGFRGDGSLYLKADSKQSASKK